MANFKHIGPLLKSVCNALPNSICLKWYKYNFVHSYEFYEKLIIDTIAFLILSGIL